MYPLILLLLLTLLLSPPAHTADDIQNVTAVWRDFVSSIRRGDYPNAHNLFSPQSQSAMPYKEFVNEYGPLSAAREMVLAKPDNQATNLDQDWAEITYGGTNPGSGRKFKVGVAFVKNDEGWGLVAARNETAERVEAGARALLKMLWNARNEAPPHALVNTLTQMHAENPILQFYRLETDGKSFQAFPQQKGLRTFYVDNWGLVKSLEQSTNTQKRTNTTTVQIPKHSALAPPIPEVGTPQHKPQKRDQMMELAEPKQPRTRNAKTNAPLDTELAEPPPRRRNISQNPPAQLALPDTIR